MEIKITPFIDISPHSKKIKKSLGSPQSPTNFSDDAKKKKIQHRQFKSERPGSFGYQKRHIVDD